MDTDSLFFQMKDSLPHLVVTVWNLGGGIRAVGATKDRTEMPKRYALVTFDDGPYLVVGYDESDGEGTVLLNGTEDATPEGVGALLPLIEEWLA